MKDMSIVGSFKEVAETVATDKLNYRFTKPKDTIYACVFKYIADEGYVTKHEVFENVLRRLSRGVRFCKSGRISENGYYSQFWNSSLKEGFVKQYSHGDQIYYMVTDKAKKLIGWKPSDAPSDPSSLPLQEVKPFVEKRSGKAKTAESVSQAIEEAKESACENPILPASLPLEMDSHVGSLLGRAVCSLDELRMELIRSRDENQRESDKCLELAEKHQQMADMYGKLIETVDSGLFGEFRQLTTNGEGR